MTRRKRSRSEARRASGAASANIASPHRAREDERGEGCERARERGARARARSCARVMRGGEVRRERASANVETLREAERDRSRLRGFEGARLWQPGLFVTTVSVFEVTTASGRESCALICVCSTSVFVWQCEIFVCKELRRNRSLLRRRRGTIFHYFSSLLHHLLLRQLRDGSSAGGLHERRVHG